jgi:hypothetical protein
VNLKITSAEELGKFLDTAPNDETRELKMFYGESDTPGPVLSAHLLPYFFDAKTTDLSVVVYDNGENDGKTTATIGGSIGQAGTDGVVLRANFSDLIGLASGAIAIHYEELTKRDVGSLFKVHEDNVVGPFFLPVTETPTGPIEEISYVLPRRARRLSGLHNLLSLPEDEQETRLSAGRMITIRTSGVLPFVDGGIHLDKGHRQLTLDEVATSFFAAIRNLTKEEVAVATSIVEASIRRTMLSSLANSTLNERSKLSIAALVNFLYTDFLATTSSTKRDWRLLLNNLKETQHVSNQKSLGF